MAKASKEEIQACMDFANSLESLINYGVLHDAPDGTAEDYSDERLAEFVRTFCKRWSLFRVTFGYQVLVDNCCDPDEDTLEWRKDVAALIEKAERE